MIKLHNLIKESIDFENFKQLVQGFIEHDSEYVRVQTVTLLLTTFRSIKSHQEKKEAVKMLIKAGILGQLKAAA
jgi:hypothetical protein